MMNFLPQGKRKPTPKNNDKTPLAMSFIPSTKGLVNNMDLFVTQSPINHSLTRKPSDYKNNGVCEFVNKIQKTLSTR